MPELRASLTDDQHRMLSELARLHGGIGFSELVRGWIVERYHGLCMSDRPLAIRQKAALILSNRYNPPLTIHHIDTVSMSDRCVLVRLKMGQVVEIKLEDW